MNKALRIPHLVQRRVANMAALLFPDRIDAILASYPKSGRTWFRFILSSYLALAFGLEPMPDLHTMFAVLPNFDRDPQRGLPAFALADRQPSPPLVAVTHRPYSRLWFRHYPVIFVLRDPRDVMVSAYFHATRQKHRFTAGIDEFLRDEAQGTTALTGYLNGWAAALQRRRHVVISYEKLSRDPQAEAGRAIDFLGLAIQPRLLAEAVQAASFGNMQKLELAKGLPGHDYDRNDRESLRMRRGTVGGFADYLSPAQVALIDRACARDLTPAARTIMRETGLQV